MAEPDGLKVVYGRKDTLLHFPSELGTEDGHFHAPKVDFNGGSGAHTLGFVKLTRWLVSLERAGRVMGRTGTLNAASVVCGVGTKTDCATSDGGWDITDEDWGGRGPVVGMNSAFTRGNGPPQACTR